MITFFEERKNYIISFLTAIFAHIALFQFGFAFRLTDPLIKLNSGFSVLELTLAPSVAGRLSCAKKTADNKTLPVAPAEKIITKPQKALNQHNITIKKPQPEKILSQKNPQPETKTENTLQAKNLRDLKITVESETGIVCSTNKNFTKNNELKRKTGSQPDTLLEQRQAKIKTSEQNVEKKHQPAKKNSEKTANSEESLKNDGDLRRKGAVTGSRLACSINPEYPQVCRRKGQQGTVKLKVIIDKHGTPLKALIISSSGYGKLDQAAVQSVMSAEFVPANKNGVPVESDMELNIKFVLEDI